MLVKLLTPGVDVNGNAVREIDVHVPGRSGCCGFDEKLCAWYMTDQVTGLLKYVWVASGALVVGTRETLELIKCPLPSTATPTPTPTASSTPTPSGTPTPSATSSRTPTPSPTPLPATGTPTPSPSPTP